MANNMNGESKGYVIANKELLCPICKCDKFYKKNIKLNTTIASLIGIEENFDGILLTGARPNIHPEEYGEEETLEHGQFDLNRDAVSLPLVRACVEKEIPIFCHIFVEIG